MTYENEPSPGLKRRRLIYRDRSEWMGVNVPAIVSQEVFDRVQTRMQQVKERYRHPITHYLLGGLVECGECGAGFSSYRRYVTKKLSIGKRRVYHKAAYKCNWRTRQGAHSRNVAERCHNKEIATHLLEETVFELLRKVAFDPAKLRQSIRVLNAEDGADHEKMHHGLTALARQIRAVEEQKMRAIDLYASDNLSEEAYINENIALDRELHRLKSKKAEFISKLPPIHKDSVDLSIRHFCDTGRVRLGTCFNFEAKRQFLLDYVERVIYRRYKVTVIGAVPIWMNTNGDRELSETRKIEFRLEGEVDTSTLHRKPRRKFSDDGRLRAWGSGGRRPRIEPSLPQPLSAPRALAKPRH